MVSSPTNRLETLSEVDYLVLDEIGRDRGTDFGVSALSELLDRRYVSAVGRRSITVLVSNFAPAKVLDDYQLDRVMDGRFRVLPVQGRSLRSTMSNTQPSLSQDVPWWQTL